MSYDFDDKLVYPQLSPQSTAASRRGSEHYTKKELFQQGYAQYPPQDKRERKHTPGFLERLANAFFPEDDTAKGLGRTGTGASTFNLLMHRVRSQSQGHMTQTERERLKLIENAERLGMDPSYY
eukprot:augustus_masked-scaffold_37-processed-gene-2.25-mRNA-1 protein AED:1.00 eAED:1.00 QI:0/-1/0/0/-1/1/1/0/123